MKINVTEQNGASIMALEGRMDATTTAVFESASRGLLDNDTRKVVVDMTALEYISSAGLRGILGMVKSMKAASGALAFCGLQPMVAEVFRISGFNAILSVYDTLDAALAALTV